GRRAPACPGAAARRVTQIAAATVDGVFVVDVDDETVAPDPLGTVEPESVDVELPLVVAAAAAGSTVVAVVRRRPPLAVSHDAGSSWREAGGGPPGGGAGAVGGDPDLSVFTGAGRRYVA